MILFGINAQGAHRQGLWAPVLDVIKAVFDVLYHNMYHRVTIAGHFEQRWTQGMDGLHPCPVCNSQQQTCALDTLKQQATQASREDTHPSL